MTLPADRPLIVLRDGVVSYNDRPILNHLDWQVNPGEHWQIVGPNGAGKSTLLSLITGDHPQGYSNDLTLFGRRRGSGNHLGDQAPYRLRQQQPASGLSRQHQRAQRGAVGVLRFDRHLSGGVGSSAAADRTMAGAARARRRARRCPFHSLSWGQQRLALIARALVKHPALLILDEPLQGLDPLNRQLVRRFIDVLIAQGATQLLFVSHHAEDAPQCITHRLSFVPDGEGGYGYQQQRLEAASA